MKVYKLYATGEVCRVDLIKAIHDELTTELDKHITIDDLAKEHDIPVTTLKMCFKSIYGLSIYKYVRKYKMERAAEALCTSDETILTIANRFGYENGSKFTAAFQKVMGKNPSTYRKENRELLPGI